MTDVLGVLLEKVLPPVVSGAGGVLLTFWRLRRTLSDRVKDLEDKARQVAVDWAREHADLKASDIELEAALGASTKVLQDELRSRMGEIASLRSVQDRLLVRMSNTATRLDGVSRDINDLQEQHRQHMKEQNDQWQGMYRTLGQLEGAIQSPRKPPARG